MNFSVTSNTSSGMSAEDGTLNMLRHELEYIINLVFEASRKHFIRLIEHE